MEGNAYLGELSASIIYLIAGARLILLSIHTGAAPERFLGVSFTMFGLSGVLYCLPEFQIFSAWPTPLYFAARVAYLPGSVLLAAFTVHVFRTDERWATWIVVGVAAIYAVGIVGSAAVGDWDGYSLSNGFFWLEWMGYTLPFGWASVEAFRQYLKARRRRNIGLCAPSVCNRMFLWSLFGAIQLLGCVFVLGQYAAYERDNFFSATWDFLYSGAILVALVVMWITFFPPAFYRRWINDESLSSTAEEG